MANGTDTVQAAPWEKAATSEAHQKLYGVLQDRKLYSKSYHEFVQQYRSPESLDKLYNVVADQNLYSKSKKEFQDQYFDWAKPSKKKEPTPSRPSVGELPSKKPEELAFYSIPLPGPFGAAFQRVVPKSKATALDKGIIQAQSQIAASREGVQLAQNIKQIQAADDWLEALEGKDDNEEIAGRKVWQWKEMFKFKQLELRASAIENYENATRIMARSQGLGQDIPETAREAFESPEAFGKFALAAIGQAAPQMIHGLSTLGTGSFALETGLVQVDMINKMMEQTGMGYEEIIEKALVDPDWAIGAGLVAGGLDFLSLGILAKATGLPQLGKRMISKYASKAATRKAVKESARKGIARQVATAAGKGGVAEAVTEPLQGIVEEVGATFGAGGDLGDVDIDLQQLLTESLAGGIPGVLFGGLGRGVTSFTERPISGEITQPTPEIREEVTPTTPTEPVAEAAAVEVPTVEETRAAAQEALQELEAPAPATVEETRAAAQQALAGLEQQVAPEPTPAVQPREEVVAEEAPAAVEPEPVAKPKVEKRPAAKKPAVKKPKVEPKKVPRETPKKEAVKKPVVEKKPPVAKKAPVQPKKVAQAPKEAAAGATFTQPSKYTGKPIEYQNREGVWHFKDSRGQWQPESAARQEIVNDLYAGKEPTKLEQAKEASKQSRAKLKEVLAKDKALGIAADPKQQAAQDYEVYKALFTHAKNLAKQGYHTVEEFAKDLGVEVSDHLRRAWDHAYTQQLSKPKIQKDYASEVRSDEGQVQVGRTEREGRKDEGRKDIQQPKETRRPEPAQRKEEKKAVPPVKGKQYGFQKTLSKKDLGDRSKKWIQEFSTNPKNRLLYEQYNIRDAAKRILDQVDRKGGFEAVHETLIEKPSIENAANTQVERQLAMHYYGEQLENALDQGETAIADQYASMINQVQTRILKEANAMGKANASLQLWRALQPDGTIKFISQQIDKANEKVLDDIYEDFGVDNKEVVAQLQQQLRQARDEAAAAIQESDALRKALDKAKSKRQFQRKAISKKGKQLAETIRKNKLPKGFAFSTTVMPPQVYNAAIEGFAIIVEKTYDVAQAIANAMRYAKRQPWYKELTPEQQAEFDKQFPKHLESLALKSVNQRKLFREAAQELEVNLNKLIYEDLTTKENAQAAIAKRVQDQLGLSERASKDVAKFVKRRFDQQLSNLTEQRLKQKFFPKNKGKTVENVRKNVASKVVDLYNAGAFQPRKSKAFYTAVAEHLNLIPQLDAQQMKKISDLSKGIQKTKGSVQLKIIGEMGLYMAQMAPVNKWQHAFNVYMGIRYAAMLSGISTQALNIMSAGFMVGMQTMADMANVAQIAREGKAKGLAGAVRYMLGNMTSIGWAAYQGIGRGQVVYRDVMANEGADQKYIEKLARQNKWDVDALDLEWKNKDSNVRKRFFRKWGAGIFRWVGTSLRAADQFVNTAAFHRELFMAKAFADENNLSIREVWKDLKQGSLSEEQKKRIADALAKEERAYEKATGKILPPVSRRRRYNELLNEEVNLDNKFKQEAEAFASDYTFMNPRNGLLASFANNFGQWLNRTKAGALVKINYLPFTNVVGNIAELMMDTIPGYGFLRAKGYSFSAIPRRIKQSTGIKSFFRPQYVEGTAQMGPRKSLVYNRQMGRAWLGMLGSLLAASVFMGNDEDDFWQLTGGQRGEEDFAEGLQNIRPKYSIGYRVNGKRKWFNYLNVPMLNVILAPIGNYNDRLRRSTFYADNQDTVNRWSMAWKLVWGTNLGTQVAKDSATMLLDMTFLSGLSNLFTDVSESVKWLTAQKPTQAAEFPPKGKPALPVVRNLFRNAIATVTRVLPQNINIINQLEKIYDPQVYTRKDIANTLKYEAGWHGSDMVVKRDVFGKPIKTLPGQQFVNVDQFFELKAADPKWEFLDKYNAIPAGITQQPHAIGDEYRYFTPKELEEYIIKAGGYFETYLEDYMSQKKRVADDAKQKKPRKEGGYDTGVQIAVNKLWTSAKSVALNEMIAKLQTSQ